MRQLGGFLLLGEVRPDPVAVVTTERSVWLVDATAYTRLPKEEGPVEGRSHLSDWDRLRDGRRLPLREATWAVEVSSGTLRMRILPLAGPPDGAGVVTGVVVQAIGLAVDDVARLRLEAAF